MKLYEKIGRKYHEVDPFWSGHPKPGIWVIQDSPGRRSMRFACRIADVPDFVPLANLENRRDDCCNLLLRLQKERVSIDDTVTGLFSLLSTEQRND